MKRNSQMPIIGRLPSGKTKVWTSASSASRELSGTGSNRLNRLITERARTNSYVGQVRVSIGA